MTTIFRLRSKDTGLYVAVSDTRSPQWHPLQCRAKRDASVFPTSVDAFAAIANVPWERGPAKDFFVAEPEWIAGEEV